MGASPSLDGIGPRPAALMSTQAPEVRVEEASDGESRTLVEGVMYHEGLNANAWGLSEAGATAVANDLVGRDYTAAHPFIRGSKYDRSVSDGQGAPIGEVLSTDVVSVDGASIDGGGYTAKYIAEVKDPVFEQRLANGLRTGDGWGVSIGIYADPETATCNICSQEMASEDCAHDRGETVEIEKSNGESETKIAGPLYSEADADHLAHVWMPAYQDASANVDAAAVSASSVPEGASVVRSATQVLAEPFDPAPVTDDAAAEAAAADDPETATDETPTVHSTGYSVTLADESVPQLASRGRGSYDVTLSNHD